MRAFSLLFVVVLTLSFGAAKSDSALTFLPHDKAYVLEQMLQKIKSAKTSIRLSIHAFTHYDLAKAIKNAAKRDVRISILLDEKSNRRNTRSQIGYLAKYENIECRTFKGKRFSNKSDATGRLYLSLFIVDSEYLMNGPSSWSYSAFSHHHNHVLQSTNKNLIDTSIQQFDTLFELARPY